MKTKEQVIGSLKKALEELDITSSLRLPIIQTIEYLQDEPVSEDLKKAAVEAFKQIVDSDKNSFLEIFKAGAKWQKQQMMANTADAMIGLPYENKDGGYTHIVDVSRPLPVGHNIIAIIFKED